MSFTAQDAYSILKAIRYDLTAAQAKVTELQRALAALNLQDEDSPFVCYRCAKGMRFGSQRTLAEHLWNVHNIIEEGRVA